LPVNVALGKPVALDDGQTFAIRAGGRTVGAGTVTALLDLTSGFGRKRVSRGPGGANLRPGLLLC
jgi:hypothetical protein